jgi:hypothetical protein
LRRALQIKFFDAQKDFDKTFRKTKGKAKRRFQEKKEIDLKLRIPRIPKFSGKSLRGWDPRGPMKYPLLCIMMTDQCVTIKNTRF